MTNTSDDKLLSIDDLHDCYRFTRKLANGGFSDVFLAEKRNSGEYIAIKMMKSVSLDEGDERKTARFRREMLLYRQLDHPNIVKVIDSGETNNGILFIVFEYIKGQNLSDLLKKEGALSLSRTVHLMMQLLKGLGEAHAKGIIHRDLKPENIMVVADETSELVKILDFGVSTFVQGVSPDIHRLTMTREFLGTPVYSAPEQLRGEPVSVKIDIYAWGLIFLECITGRSPFTGQTIPAVVQQQLASSPIPMPAALISHQLGTLLRWTLEKNADRRAGSVPVIISHLETVALDSIPQQNGFLTGDFPNVESVAIPQVVIYDTVSAAPERRQVTTLCCIIDMQRLPPGISNDVLDELYQDLMETGKNLVKRYGAYISNDSGDRIFACFGFPVAGDTDARRAARSALELANTLTQRNAVFSRQHGIRITFRIGIHTGTITVRRHSQNNPVLSGLVLNNAGKLSRAAQQDSILVSKSSFSLLKDSIEMTEISDNTVSVLFSNEQVYRMIGEKRHDSLIDIFTDTISPMIGRDGELARLSDAWTAVRTDLVGNVILLQGEAGIGKSRLASEFAKKIAMESCGWLECRCLPEGKNSALHPVLSFLRTLFRLSETSSSNDNSLSLEHHLKMYGVDCSIAMPLFGSWLGVPTDSYTMLQFSPQKQKEIVLHLSSEIFARAAQDSGSVIMIEDLHWADPTTIEFLPKLFEQVKKRGVLLCMSARPAFVPPWNSNETEVIALSGLNDEHVEEVARVIFGSEEIGRDTLAKIVSRVDGVPLFIEEIAKLIREKKLNNEEIPSTLIDLLTSKMDHLGPARETVQLASVIGREFDYNLIEKVSSKDTSLLLADLDHLISAGIIHIQLVVGNPHYMFHHALMRDAVYESVDKNLRKEMHTRIAEVLERDFTDIATCQPETLAFHWAGAGYHENAIVYGISAATQYLSKSLYSEAIYHACESLTWIMNIKDDSLKIEKELQLLQLLIPSYISTKGFAASEVNKINLRMDVIRSQLPRESQYYTSIIWGKVIYYETTPDYDQMENYLNEGLIIGLELGDNDLLSALHSVRSHYCLSHGTYKKSVINADISTDYYHKKMLNNHSTVFGHDSKVLSLSIKALALAILGDVNLANDCIESAISFANELNDASSIGLALAYQLCVFHECNEKQRIRQYCDTFRVFINQYGLGLWLNILDLYDSWSNNDLEKAKNCLDCFHSLGIRQIEPYWNFITAQIEYETGLYCDCMDRIESAIIRSNESGEIFYVPELYRLKAQCICRTDPHSTQEIEEAFWKAYHFAENMDAHLFKVRILNISIQSMSNYSIRNKVRNELSKEISYINNSIGKQEHYEFKESQELISSF
ncbi:MAG: TOMM system kinase/cyclase fusion protein [Chitinispirillaceae bacterium]|nr:TOMM system kinase/cyclase fusion protein [Chitinispirillaceae bacterium]